MGIWTRIDKRVAAELREELHVCTGYFYRATVIARDLKVLGSLAFRDVDGARVSAFRTEGCRPTARINSL